MSDHFTDPAFLLAIGAALSGFGRAVRSIAALVTAISPGRDVDLTVRSSRHEQPWLRSIRRVVSRERR